MATSDVLDFTGQTFTIGLDVHKKNWSVRVQSAGVTLRQYTMDPKPEALHRWLVRNYPGGRYRSVYEAGFCGFWIHRRLCALGIENIVINPADVPTTNKEIQQKTDKRDTGKLARELANGSLTGIYIPDTQTEQLRSLCRLRHRMSEDMTRVKNRIKGHLHYYGIQPAEDEPVGNWSGAYLTWLDGLAQEGTARGECLRYCLNDLRHFREQLAGVLKELRKQLKGAGLEETIRLLQTVPGVGLLTAITLAAEIMDIGRFKDLDHLASYVGLIPWTRDSGETENHGGLTSRRNRYLRHLLVEAAWVAIRQDPALLQSFSALALRMKKQKAIIRIARKLLNRIRCVLRTRQAYVVGVVR